MVSNKNTILLWPTGKSHSKVDHEFLDRLRIASGGNYSRFARKCGLKPPALRHYVERGLEPTRPVLLKIANSSGLDLRWLAEGVGPMLLDTKDKCLSQFAPPNSGNPSFTKTSLRPNIPGGSTNFLRLIRRRKQESESILFSQSRCPRPSSQVNSSLLINEADLLNDSSVMIQEDNSEADSEHVSLDEFERRYEIVAESWAWSQRTSNLSAAEWIGKLYSTHSMSQFRNYLAYFFDSIWQSSCPRMFCLYFVGGTFAAGNSTLCQTLSGLLPAEHLKASELIGYAPNPKDATGKATDQVQSGFPNCGAR